MGGPLATGVKVGNPWWTEGGAVATGGDCKRDGAAGGFKLIR